MAAKYKVVNYRYSVTKHGGATGMKSTGVYIPKNSIISKIKIAQITALAPTTKKIGLYFGTDLIFTAATGGNPAYWATGVTTITPANELQRKNTSAREIKLNFADGRMTAGCYDLYFEFIQD